MSFRPSGIHQFKSEGVDECLQYGVVFYHPRKNHLRRVFHQQEVGDVQSLTALSVGRHLLQQVRACGTPAYGFRHEQPLPPFLRSLKVGEEDNLPTFFTGIGKWRRSRSRFPVIPDSFGENCRFMRRDVDRGASLRTDPSIYALYGIICAQRRQSGNASAHGGISRDAFRTAFGIDSSLCSE